MELATDTVIKVELMVASETVTPDEVAARLGVAPDRAVLRGERRTPRSPASRFNRWELDLATGSSVMRIDDACAKLAALGDQVALSLGAIVREKNVSAAMVIVQRVTDPSDPQQYGIAISAAAVCWLGIAGASISIDQYLPEIEFDGQPRAEGTSELD